MLDGRTRFAPITPVSLTHSIFRDRADLIGPYHLLLAHDILAREDQYGRLYDEVHETFEDTFIIVDNSLVELGKPMNADELVEAANIVRADCIVLPDRMGDARGTVDASRIASAALQMAKCSYPFMGVVHGHDINDIMGCAEALVRFCNISYFAVPRILTRTLGTRTEVVNLLTARYGLPIHLLGFSEKLADDAWCAKQHNVWGIDSAMPVWMGQQGRVLPEYPPRQADYGKRPPYFFDMHPDAPHVVTLANLHIVQQWLKP